VIDVNISHTYIGDLVVRIIAPDTTSVLLHNRIGGSEDNIVTSYPTLRYSASDIFVLVGKSIQGNWTLMAHDQVAADSGVLNNWAITLYYNIPAQAPSNATTNILPTMIASSNITSTTVRPVTNASTTITTTFGFIIG
jgi:subtilisin-like proprotein convertase family protein